MYRLVVTGDAVTCVACPAEIYEDDSSVDSRFACLRGATRCGCMYRLVVTGDAMKPDRSAAVELLRVEGMVSGLSL